MQRADHYLGVAYRMSKYNKLKILKMTKAKKHHLCSKCGKEIVPGDNYYKEQIKDKFIHALNLKKYCALCYEKYGNLLL